MLQNSVTLQLIFFACFPVACRGGIFDEPEGHLASPGYPEPPTHALSCQYVISVESGFTIFLNFSDNFQIEAIETEEGHICPYHWLEVYCAASVTRNGLDNR